MSLLRFPIRRIGGRWSAAVAAVLLALVSFGAGAWVERSFPGTLPLVGTRSDADQFDQAKVQQAARIIRGNYYDAGVGGGQLSRGSVQGMVSSLDDPFSQYLTPEQYRMQLDALAGRHDGVIGVTVAHDQGPAAALPLVVLVDQGSASSSEIVAGSLQAHGRARLVGARTFGKGSVQTMYALRDGSAINLTIQQWLLPDGRSINGSGLAPDVPVDLAQQTAMFDVVQPARGHDGDTQLNRALAMLQG